MFFFDNKHLSLKTLVIPKGNATSLIGESNLEIQNTRKESIHLLEAFDVTDQMTTFAIRVSKSSFIFLDKPLKDLSSVCLFNKTKDILHKVRHCLGLIDKGPA